MKALINQDNCYEELGERTKFFERKIGFLGFR
jgi:hypothetical protein